MPPHGCPPLPPFTAGRSGIRASRLPRPRARPRRLARRRAAPGRALGPHGLLRRRAPRPRAAPHRRAVRLPRECRPRCRRTRLPLQRAPHRARPPCGWPPPPPPLGDIARGLASGLRRSLPRSRRLKLHARPPRLRQADCDRLFGRSRAVLALTDVVHLLADELAGLCRRRLALGRVLVRALAVGSRRRSADRPAVNGGNGGQPWGGIARVRRESSGLPPVPFGG